MEKCRLTCRDSLMYVTALRTDKFKAMQNEKNNFLFKVLVHEVITIAEDDVSKTYGICLKSIFLFDWLLSNGEIVKVIAIHFLCCVLKISCLPNTFQALVN